MTDPHSQSTPPHYDVAILGGGFAGAASALLLRRRNPTLRVLVVEHQTRTGRKVGESTVEVTSFFINHVLQLTDYLAAEQLDKHGLRFWGSDGPMTPLGEVSEFGPWEAPGLPSFQLDRGKLDEYLLTQSGREGCDVARPVKVVDIDLAWPQNTLTLKDCDAEGKPQGEGRTVTARWVIDATGRHAFLARRLRLQSRVEEHPTAAVWARFRGVANLDDPSVLPADARLDHGHEGRIASRRLATNHFTGYGWWCWVIPLVGGETSIGLVYNKELFSLPGERDEPLVERFRRFITTRPGLADLLRDAELDQDDWLAYNHLPYRTSQYMDRGWALVGDAASFIDPYYSPGLDHASISLYATTQLISGELEGEFAAEGQLAEEVAEHNRRFLRSYDRWLSALYLGKYEILGDIKMVGCAFLVETSLYYLGVVEHLYKDVAATAHPVFGLPAVQATIAYRGMRFFNRRMNALARTRRRIGIYGRDNRGLRHLVTAFGLGAPARRLLVQGLKIYLSLEWETFFHRLTFRFRPATQPKAASAASAASPTSTTPVAPTP
jgi:flavin-dependent dehydrogenase